MPLIDDDFVVTCGSFMYVSLVSSLTMRRLIWWVSWKASCQPASMRGQVRVSSGLTSTAGTGAVFPLSVSPVLSWTDETNFEHSRQSTGCRAPVRGEQQPSDDPGD